MFKCNKCQGTKIRTRTNYSHGRKSKSITTASCMACNSTDIEVVSTNRRRGRRN